MEGLLPFATLGGWIASGCAFVGLLIAFFLFPALEEPAKLSLDVPPGKRELGAQYEMIGKGALALSSGGVSQLLGYLADEFVILAKNSRPDAKGRNATFLIRLENAKEERVVLMGETLFLREESTTGEAFSVPAFSSQPTGFWIQPHAVDRNSLLIEVGRKGERAQFAVPIPPALEVREEAGFVGTLKQARCWGTDALIQSYGGDEYATWRTKIKVEFPGSSVCFVSPGDYLSWQEGRWQVIALEDAFVDAPLAHIKSITPQYVEIQAWDETGFSSFSIKLERQPAARMNEKIESMLSSIRLRTATQITCVLGKRRMVLKTGDWLLKTATGWRNLKRAEEIDACLMHRIRGQLFIFDALEKSEGKALIKGHLFDEMRTQMQEVTIPVTVGGPAHPSKKSKRVLAPKQDSK